MTKLVSTLRKEWLEHPEESVDLIVHVSGDVHQRGEALTARGVNVRRHFALISALGVRCKGKAALGLLDISWIIRVEPDQPVKALRR